MGEDDRKPIILRNFSLSTIWFLKKFLKRFQKYRGGGQGHLNFFKQKEIFFKAGFPDKSHQSFKSYQIDQIDQGYQINQSDQADQSDQSYQRNQSDQNDKRDQSDQNDKRDQSDQSDPGDQSD